MVSIDFTGVSLDVIAGTFLGSIGGVIELTASTLAKAVMPTLFTATTIPVFAGIVGVGLFAGAIFGRIGQKNYKASTAELEKQ
jgi:hypothetical protein